MLLRRGFGTIHSMLAGFQKMPAQITWTPPGEADFVACAVFRCNPSFNDEIREDDPSRTRRFITNFDACVLLFFVEDAQEGGVRLAVNNQYPRQAACESDLPEAREAIEQLSFGCWAYDDTKLIAASDLQSLVPSDLVSVVPRIPTDAACASDGADCYDTDHGFFGICAGTGGPCRHRCVDAEDCEAAARHDGDSHSDSCTWTCPAVPNSEVGVCATNGP